MEPEVASRLPLEARLLNDDGGCCGLMIAFLFGIAFTLVFTILVLTHHL